MESSEKWKDISGYEGVYQVSDKGRVKALSKKVTDPNGRVRCYKEKILKQHPTNKYGHMKIGLYDGTGRKGRKEFLVHRLVLISFVGEPEEGQESLHKDGNPKNNTLDNLRWGTSKENSQDSINHGTLANGIKLPQSVLTEEKVLSILKDQISNYEEYGVSKRHIRSIKQGKYWKHLYERV
jgi:hypothetical protein